MPQNLVLNYLIVFLMIPTEILVPFTHSIGKRSWPIIRRCHFQIRLSTKLQIPRMGLASHILKKLCPLPCTQFYFTTVLTLLCSVSALVTLLSDDTSFDVALRLQIKELRKQLEKTRGMSVTNRRNVNYRVPQPFWSLE